MSASLFRLPSCQAMETFRTERCAPKPLGAEITLRIRTRITGNVSVSRWRHARGMVRASSSEPAGAAVTVSEPESSEPTEEEKDQQDIKDVLRVVELLKVKRDMVFNEIRLAIMIEDPRATERREQLGIEDECSRDDLAETLVEVGEGKVPKDRVALRALAEEMRNWPMLEYDNNALRGQKKELSPYAKVTPTGVDPALAARRAGMSAWDLAMEEQAGQNEKASEELASTVPKWMGYVALYGFSSLPVVIVVIVAIILFVNSLQ
eukprot:TRINITY_DN30565_c0_g1_i1.p1 TRINITY_DN30565_c0_g1~~TRINITY_DN30565_c0_g1_i1.p1  ORF type:complete len:264 (-),score=48.93 TRINITY_DN30565_c0_g1_i1:292-1083(-)